MVSTRNHPTTFPPPEASPTKSPRKSRTSTPAPTASASSPSRAGPSAVVGRSVQERVAETAQNGFTAISGDGGRGKGAWSHTASNVTLAWIAVSIPLVIWDSLYILLRPHTMAGGFLQWPFWKPYEIYAAIDYVYGQPGWDLKDGFGGGQGAVNVIETILYGLYIMIVYNHGVKAAGGSGVQIGSGVKGWASGGVRVRGIKGNTALIIGFTASVMTLSKTILYYLVEYYTGFKNTAHNDWFTLFLFYGVMNGLWVIFPAYMTVTFGSDILAGLDAAVQDEKKQN
ncbi:uncharacterized protein CC84DRAFT_1182761 [Paraphaeosphaeria sporulosa]|uniref:Uncharacterized protein n=1 Tax=Paraphaeosphaeria sporulosa TaxID=1460663 RepID=A0A177CYQ8_9PLEO|nr:uncharacterized protein CC84DRAFT_1182761 [Paraphaeosphaeria sporulosa]OAG11950.1 hypothetical protein CC84DRAFT_1182761 [Paraphaeosphaeria sporulosa]